MKPFAAIALFLSVCATPVGAIADTRDTAQAPGSRAVFPFPVHRTQLPNGLMVLSVEYDSPGIIAYYTVVRTGSRNELEPGLSGFAHFFEHMMFRGTPRFDEGKYNSALKALGADSNAFTTDDWTCYHATASAAALETIVDLESDRFQNLKYDEPAFQKEARAVLGEYNKSASSPIMLLDEKMQDTAFTTHTYKHTTIGFLNDIQDMPNQYQYSLKFFDRWYRPENCIVLVVGDVKHDRLVDLAKKHYGGWKRGTAKIDIPQEPPQKEEKQLALLWKGQTLPYLYIGYHTPAFDPRSRDVAALDLLAEAAFSASSPLYRKLVLEQRQVEMLLAGAESHRDATLFTVMARLTDEKHLDAVRDDIYRTFEEAAKTPVTSQRLADIKSHVRYHFAMGLKTPDAVARTLGQYLELTGDPNSVNQMYETYEAVTAEDIQRVAAKHFVPTNRTCITLTPEKQQAAGGPGQPCAAEAVAPQPAAVPRQTSIDGARVGLEGPAHAPTTLATPTLVPPTLVTQAPSRRSVQRLGTQYSVLSTQYSVLSTREAVTQFHASRLDNEPAGQTTILVNPASPLVALRVAFRVGSKDDPPGKEGVASLTARMMAEGGTKSYSYDQILERMYPMAGAIGSHADKETTVFTGDIHRDKLAEFYALFSEMILSPRFDPADFDRLREEQLNYVSKILRSNDDENFGKWTLQVSLYPKHPYGHVNAGTVSGLKAITLDNVKKFYAENYSLANVHLGVAGGADAAFVKKLREDFAKLPPIAFARPEAGLPAPHLPKDLELTIVQKECIATAISIGFPLDLTRRDDDFYALAVANSALGEHRTFNGRLMNNMRGKRGLNYGDYSYIENFIQDGGSTFPIPNIPREQQFFSIWIRPVPPDKGVFALRQAIRELEMIAKDGLDEEEFEATRNFLVNYSKLWVQTLSRRLGYEMDGKTYGRDSLVTELDRRLPKLTRDQANPAIRKHLQAKNLAVAVVTRDAEAFRNAVLSGEPTPLKYDTEGTPEEILREDKLIEAYPLRVNRERLRVVPADRMFE